MKIKLALDWTPNTNHIGFFIAKELGYYKDNGIKIELLDPIIDNYYLTPAKKVELGKADLALCPTESIISFRTKKNKFNMIGIAAIYKEDLSAIAVKNFNITSPKKLDNLSYASYNAKYEDKIVKKMIINDGGQGNIKISYPKKLGIWNTILRDEFDSTWIFINWEGIEAEDNGIKLNLFKMSDYKIPYSYSPVIVTSELYFEKNKKELKSFLSCSKKGFLFAKNNPKQAIEIFKKFVPKNEKVNLEKSLNFSSKYFGNSENWGIMDDVVVDNFLKWLHAEGLESKKFTSKDIISNELLKKPI